LGFLLRRVRPTPTCRAKKKVEKRRGMLHKIEMNAIMKKEVDFYLDKEFFDAKVGRLVGVGLRVVVHEHFDVYILNETVGRNSLR
jgi:hypothetical protein